MRERAYPPSPPPSLPLQIKNIANDLEVQLREALKALLDPTIYKLALEEGPRDAEGRYLFATPTQDMLFYYQAVLNLLIDFQKMMDRAEYLFQQFSELGEKGIWGKITAFLSGVDGAKEELISLIAYASHFLQGMVNLRLGAFLGYLPALRKLRGWRNLLAPLETMAQQFDSNSFVDTYKRRGRIWKGHLGLWPQQPITLQSFKRIGMENITAACETILHDLSGATVLVPLSAELEKTLNVVKQLLKKPKEATRTQSLIKLIKIIYQGEGLFRALLQSLPASWLSANKVMKPHLLAAARQLNLILRDWYLFADYVESKCYLKEGYLVSAPLSKIVMEFNEWLESLGYEIEQPERYPYTLEIVKQRQQLRQQRERQGLAVGRAEEKPDFKQAFLRERWFSLGKLFVAQSNGATETKKSEQNSFSDYKRRLVNLHIDKKIAELSAEIKSRWLLPTKTKKKKVELLVKFKGVLENAKLDESCHSILETMKKDDGARLLEQGRTGQLMHTLNLLTSKPEDRLELINLELRDLCFFRQLPEQTKTKRIHALRLLHRGLEQRGYRLQEVLEQLSIKSPEEHKILIQNEALLLAKLKEIDSYLPDLVLGKK
ncbi:MAG TPA: hypothetical protein VLH77_07030, partial [Gammaproteobacteria bacterium]|nr:hypothetical protein [Gammaproteobacteria bacterium]